MGLILSKLRIGVLVDSEYCSKYVKEFIEQINKTNLLEIEALLIQDIKIEKNYLKRIKRAFKKKGFSYILGKILYLFVLELEKLNISNNKFFFDHYNLYRLPLKNNKIFKIKPMISTSGFIYRYDEKDISIIESLDLDIIVRCGSGILRGKILNAAKYGIISFHHGDNRKYRGGPAGFWEVLNKDPSTGFVIQRLTDELDGGDILFRGAFPTQSYFSLNQAMLYTKSNIYMKLVLENIALTKSVGIEYQGLPYNGILYSEPGFLKTSLYLIYILRSLVSKILNRVFKIKSKWNVSYIASAWTNAVLWKAKPIPNPKNHYLADPFIFFRDNTSYVFVEDYDLQKKKGAIRLYKIIDDEVVDLGIIIEEAFHLSFPYIFEYEGGVYMCPETSENQEIRIYECTNFPTNWVFHSVAINKINAVDSMIFKKDDLWWLFTNTDNSKVQEFCSELEIYYSDNPLSGKWIPHKKNPVIVNSELARNGGILNLENEFYRVSQRQGFLQYGESISIRKINILSEDQYSENTVCALNSDFNKMAIGIHHMHSKKNITVFDYCKKS
jgi:hypothetical protein